MAASTIGPYQLLDLVGRGGMGAVYRAFDTRRGRHVALKLLNSDLARDPNYRARFARESRLAAQLNSPHVIPIHDFGELDGGQLFIDMRLCNGVDLGTLLERDGPLPPWRAIEIVSQLAEALGVAHRQGLVHRDVKPANTMIETADDRDFVYLVDFGIVRALGGDHSSSLSLTATGALVGTMPYMAPELFTDEGAVTPKVDTYALGCLMHETLTGRRPFHGTSLAALIHQHLSVTPPPVSALRPDLPAELDHVVHRALSKNPEQRWDTVNDLARAARRALTTTSPPSSTVLRQPTDPWPPRSPQTSSGELRPAPAPPPHQAVSQEQDVDRDASLSSPTPQREIKTAAWEPDSITSGDQARRSRGPRWGWWISLATLLVAVAIIVPILLAGSNVSKKTPNTLATITVGGTPAGEALAAGGARLFVANDQLNTVAVIDTARRATIASIALDGATGVAASPDGSTIYATSPGTLTAIDAMRMRIRASIPISGGALFVAIAPNGRTAYVTGGPSRVVSVVDLSLDSVSATIPVDGQPFKVAISPDNSYVYSVNYNNGTIPGSVTRISTRTDRVVNQFQSDPGSTAIAVSPDGRRVYVANAPAGNGGSVSVFDVATGALVSTIATGGNPQAITVEPDGRRAYVADYSGSVFEITTLDNAVTTYRSEAEPGEVVLSSDAKTAYISNRSGSVSIVGI